MACINFTLRTIFHSGKHKHNCKWLSTEWYQSKKDPLENKVWLISNILVSLLCSKYCWNVNRLHVIISGSICILHNIFQQNCTRFFYRLIQAKLPPRLFFFTWTNQSKHFSLYSPVSRALSLPRFDFVLLVFNFNFIK